jgi:hypothetical protein
MFAPAAEFETGPPSFKRRQAGRFSSRSPSRPAPRSKLGFRRSTRETHVSLPEPIPGATAPVNTTICTDCPRLGCERRAGRLRVRHALDAADEGGPDLQEDGQPAGGSASLRSHGILPANTRRKSRSTTLTIRNSVRLSSSEGISSRTTSKWQSSCSPTARLPACQRGCSPNRLHNTEYANPQRFHLHFCSLCVSKSMRS